VDGGRVGAPRERGEGCSSDQGDRGGVGGARREVGAVHPGGGGGGGGAGEDCAAGDACRAHARATPRQSPGAPERGTTGGVAAESCFAGGRTPAGRLPRGA